MKNLKTTIFVSSDKTLIDTYMSKFKFYNKNTMHFLNLNLSNEHTNVNHLYGENNFTLDSIILDEKCDVKESFEMLVMIGFKKENILSVPTYIVSDGVKKVYEIWSGITYFNIGFLNNKHFPEDLFKYVENQIYNCSSLDGNIFRNHI